MAEENFFFELINKQQNSYERIKSIQSNYKKDPLNRKSIDYLKKRIEALQAHWDEFLSNHEFLKQYELAKSDHDYYKVNIYQITKTMFDETMESMTRLQSELSKTASESSETTKPKVPDVHGTLKFGKSKGFPRDEDTDQDTDRQISRLLRNQMLNFNAFERAVSKIHPDDTKEKWQLQDHLKIIQTKWESIDKIHWELSYLLQGSDEEYEEKYDYWEHIYDDLKENLNRKMFETSHYEKTTPRMELPEFNGSYTNWVSFRDLFYEMIHNNPTLNKTQKMKFLKSKLKGEAERLIKHLPVSADNYDACLDIIQHRFDNKRLLFTSYIETLLNQSVIDKPNSSNLMKLHDTTKECLNALENIGINISIWGPLIVHLLSSKLDETTYGEYIKDIKHSRELPDLDEFMKFLELKFMTLESARTKKGDQKHNYLKNYNEQRSTNSNKANKWTKTFHSTVRNCPLCKSEHVLRQCPTFIGMNVAERNETTNNLNFCKNCLFSHGENKCTSTKRCRFCNYKHHSLLHDDNFKTNKQWPSSSTAGERTSNHINGEQEILLTTLQLNVRNKEGEFVILRALLDQGSQVSLITENAAQRLNLPRNKMNASVTGVGSIMGTSKGMIKLQCRSIHSDYTFQTEALVMRKLISNLPNSTIKVKNWTHLDNIKLADPDFNISGPIDLLLGADIYSDVIMEGILKRNNNLPVAQQTKLGWILCGATKQFNCLVTLGELDNLSRFWEVEEVPTEPEPTSGDTYCEEYYTQTTEKLSSGRYVVKMPMKENYEENLGNSKSKAVAQFLHLERKMARQEYFAKLYKEFIKEYIELGHMKPVTKPEGQVEVYLPHHGVLRESSTSTKLRAIFNASMKTDSGFSLNDLMEKGPNLQKDILSLIIKWRSYKYALTADIEKMYRQLIIHQDQQCLQKIIWREFKNGPLMEMQLCTLTYGTKAAPFIAMRTLQQLAQDEGNAFPLAQKTLRQEFYMDDVISGHHSIETTKQLQKELYELLNKGRFILRKWATNEPSILTELDEKEKRQTNFNFKQQEFSKTLGLAWNDVNDTFYFNSEAPSNVNNETYTKRKLLSEISKIYDPLGWLAPMTIQTKLIFQKLWRETYKSIGWDQSVPSDIANAWTKIKVDLSNINNISLPRWIQNENNAVIELQAFCDASEQAYACVIYSRTTSPSGAYVVTLLAAKTKVAPIKNKTTIPKLELCAAVLVAKLLTKITKVLSDYELKVSCWTDSKVVLAWLQGKPNKYEKYISNRVKEITNIVPATHWGYVKSNENPADCATRGLSPSKLVNFSLWWEGPQWLKKQEEQFHLSSVTYSTNEGLVKNCFTTEPMPNKNELIYSLLERYSDLDRITRILAWVISFADASHNRMQLTKCNELNLSEIKHATNMIIKSVQDYYFKKEIRSLRDCGKLPNKSNILKLNPYLDTEGIVRVGGRLQHSNLPKESKHPILIPAEGRLTEYGRRIELLRRHYWDRWSKEYLHLLRNRNKWQQRRENIQKGQLVLVKETNLPPGKWAMGRVGELHPGSDDLVRVVTLKTKNGEIKRPISKLAPLPINEAGEEAESQKVSPKPDIGNKNTTSRRTKKNVNSLFMVLLLAFTMLSCGASTSIQHFRISKLTDKNPIYFDLVGNIQLIQLLVYFNMTTFWQSTTKVEEFVNHLTQICATMPGQQCHGTIKQLNFEMNQLNEYNKLLLSQHQQRRRRGYVNGIGNLASTLFGVLDSNFADKYAQDIHKIQANERYLLELIKNQTLIIEAQDNILKKNEDFVKTQLSIVQQYITKTRNETAALENRFQIMQTMNDVNAGALTASLLLSVLRRNQQMLLNALTDIYRGNLDMELFTPQQLTEQLNNIAGLISTRLTLPIKNSKDIQSIYKLIYVKARLTEKYLLFELHIPLLSDDEYKLYRNIPIPTQQAHKQCKVIATSTKYIGVNFVKNTYIQIEEFDLQQCSTMEADNYICHTYTPISNLHGPTASCEAKILSQHVYQNITCDWIQQQCSDQWTKLQRPNTWLYNCITDCPTRIVCENQVTTTMITKAGLLALGQDCVIQHKDSTIYSHNVFSSKTKDGISLEVPEIDSVNDMKGTSKMQIIALPQLNLSEEHRLLENQIKAQKEKESLPYDLSVHDIGNYTISSLLVGGIVVTIIVWRFREHLTVCTRTRNKTTRTSTKTREATEEIELEDMAPYSTIKGGHLKNIPQPAATGFTL